MSVLNLPRFVFSGFTDWNPDTVNNSNSIYNEQTAEPVPQPGVAWDQFVSWLLESNGSTNPANLQPNGSWNVYGDHGVTFMNAAGEGAKITGITLPKGPVISDPLIGAGVQLLGLLYSDSRRPAPARLVDIEPYGPFTSQIFYESIAIGSAAIGVTGRGACRMFSRWPNFSRNLGALPIAGSMGVIWQTAVNNADLKWAGLDQSPALASLKSEAEKGSNQGIVLQFASYHTLYYQTVTYQGRPIRSGGDLIWAYQNGYRGPNPARSVLLGTIGVWGAGELASAPTQRLLVPSAQVTQTSSARSMNRFDPTPHLALEAAPAPVSLGPAVAILDPERNVVTVDFIATFPEADATLEKADLGTFVLQVSTPTGPVQIGPLFTPAMYNRGAYENSGGISEFPFPATLRDSIIKGTLQLVQQGAKNPALLESAFLAETDERGSYIDEGQTNTLNIRVYEKGATPKSAVSLLAAQYDTGGNLITTAADQIINLTSAVLPVANGAATLSYQPVQSGCCFAFFYPFTGNTPPSPPASAFATPADFFAAIRVLPFDDELEKNTPDSELSFSFIYNRVLSTYDLIYPVMSLVRNLHDKNVVAAMGEQLKFAVSLDGFQSTLYMPITRELSAGKRALLQRYVNLLPNNVPPDPTMPT